MDDDDSQIDENKTGGENETVSDKSCEQDEEEKNEEDVVIVDNFEPTQQIINNVSEEGSVSLVA